MAETLVYNPPPVLKAALTSYLPGGREPGEGLFYDWVVGPVGGGKTTLLFFKLCRLAKMQKPGPDGKRRTRCVVVRNTRSQLVDTTISSWSYWFKEGVAGRWSKTNLTFMLTFDDVECEVMFRPLDTPEDVERVLSLEVTFAIIDEFVQLPREIVEALSGRLGRYPPPREGGATNWGMWGASNVSTEDNWWYDYLHDASVVQKIAIDDLLPLTTPRAVVTAKLDAARDGRIVRYFLQPSALSEHAENLANLPGGRGYYDSLRKGKTEAWVKQFVEAEWGFSVAGKPVVPSFKPALHIATSQALSPVDPTLGRGPLASNYARAALRYDPERKLVVGLDPGLGGMAAVIGQEDAWGRLLVLGEVVAEGESAERFLSTRLRPYLRARFPDADVTIAPDPAAANRAQTDARSVVDVFARYYRVAAEKNNRLPLRLDAIEHYTARLTDVGPALQIDATMCPRVVRALKGGWRYAMDQKRGVIKGIEPEKNAHSHPGDAFGYLARYFHRQGETLRRYGAVPFVAPRFNARAYHIR